MRILVTGAAGFTGSHLMHRLAAAGHDVFGVDAFLPTAHPVVSHPRSRTVATVDVREAAQLAPHLSGVDLVCHQAAVVGSGVDASDLPRYAAHNDLGTAVLLAAMSRAGIARFLLASSMVVYGEGRYGCPVDGDVEPGPRRVEALRAGDLDPACPHCGRPLDWRLVEEATPLRPRTGYAASKTAQEHLALAWALQTGGAVVALRYHNVYGPLMPQDTPYSGVAAVFRSALERGEPPPVFEDGGQTRDFVHVDDVATANVLAVGALAADAEPFRAYNVCSGRPRTIGQVAALLSAAAGGPDPVVTGRFRAGDVRHVVAAPQRAARELGFTAAVDPDEGIPAFAHAPLRESARPDG